MYKVQNSIAGVDVTITDDHTWDSTDKQAQQPQCAGFFPCVCKMISLTSAVSESLLWDLLTPPSPSCFLGQRQHVANLQGLQ